MLIKNKRKAYHTVEQRVYSCQYHVVLCSKFKRKVFEGDVKKAFEKWLKDQQENIGYTLVDCEMVVESIHLVLDVDPKVGIHNVVVRIKSGSSNYIRNKFKDVKTRFPSLWSRSYFIASVGSVALLSIKSYIQAQTKSQ